MDRRYLPSYGETTVRRTLDLLGIEILSESRGWGSALCPLHEDSSQSFGVELTDGGWVCRADCGRSDDLADLVARVRGMDPEDARHQLRSGMVADGDALRDLLRGRPEPREAKPVPLFYERGRVPGYWLRRGFTVETARAWDVGWDPELRAVVVPFTVNGRLVGLVRRTVDRDARAKYLDSPGMPKSRYLFGLDHVPPDAEEVALVEGPLDAVWLWQCGYPAVAELGSALSEEQAEILRSRFRRVTLALDGDAAGRHAEEIARGRLTPRVVLSRLELPPGRKDPAECRPAEIAAAMARRAWYVC